MDYQPSGNVYLKLKGIEYNGGRPQYSYSEWFDEHIGIYRKEEGVMELPGVIYRRDTPGEWIKVCMNEYLRPTRALTVMERARLHFHRILIDSAVSICLQNKIFS